METSLATMIELWKKFGLSTATGSKLVSRGPCFLAYANAFSSGGGVGLVHFLNGVDGSGEYLATLYIPAGDTRQLQPLKPLLFDKGLYVSTSWGDGRWTCQFIRISELTSLDEGSS